MSKTTFKKGNIPWNKGKHIAPKHKGLENWRKKGGQVWNKGKKPTPKMLKLLKTMNIGRVGKNSAHWKGGKPKCIDCGKELQNYKAKRCQSCSKAGDRHPIWKGENATYRAIHHWVEKWKGKPNVCENCGKIGAKINGRWNIDWANIDHTYRRILEDYIGMCKSCHRKYDAENYLK